jgi:hypothetical protein
VKRALNLLVLLLLPIAALAGEAAEVLNTPKSLNLTHQIIGYLSIAVAILFTSPFEKGDLFKIILPLPLFQSGSLRRPVF